MEDQIFEAIQGATPAIWWRVLLLAAEGEYSLLAWYEHDFLLTCPGVVRVWKA